jgi:hypothetical protein
VVRTSSSSVSKIYPNVFVIGAAKSGTTSLVAGLGRHPDVFVPALKEPFYFAFPETQPKWTGPSDPNDMPVYRLNDYLALYEPARDKLVRIDASTIYLYDPAVPARIAAKVPEAKIIVILRHPVDRAYSAFLHIRGRTTEEDVDFREALRKEEWRIQAGYEHLWHYRAMSRYSAQLTRWYQHFPRNNICVLLYDDLKERPHALYENVCDFLDLEFSHPRFVADRENVSIVPRNRTVKRALLSENVFKKSVARFIPASWRRFIWRFNAHKPQCPPDIHAKLCKEFADEILAVQKITGIDLSRWLSARQQSATL